MTLPPWLDRLWLVLIAISFLVIVPLWLILSVERYGPRLALGGVALALWMRYRPR